MAQTRKDKLTQSAAKHAGLIGHFSIDYRTNMIRGNGTTGPYFQILKSRMFDGVALSELDRAYHPFDLENIRRIRAGFVGRGGRYTNQFRVFNPLAGGFSHVEAQFSVNVDQFGIPVSAAGLFIDITDFTREEPTNTYSDLINIAGHLKEARRLAERHGMDFLSRNIAKSFDVAAEIAVNRVLE